MATAAEEALKVLMDLGATETQFVNAEALARANQLEALSQPTARDLQRAAPSTADLKRQQEAQEQAQARQLFAEDLIKSEANKLDLSSDQQYVSRLSGEFDAVLRTRLQDLRERARDDETRNRIALAQNLLQQDYDLFRQANAQEISALPEQVLQDTDYVRDLMSPDGITGALGKAVTTAVAGIPGLAGIGAGLVGLEGTAQALGRATEFVQDFAPTDLGSSASSQELADIQARTKSGELPLSEGIAAAGRAGLTDRDSVGDLVATTLGAAIGGGPVRAAAGLAARAAGLAAPTGRVARGAAQALPAAGVGIGAGVDGDITTPQAQLLAATTLASGGIGGLTAGLGGAVAESALGNLGRSVGSRVSQRVAPNASAPARTVGGALTPRTTGQQVAAATGRTASSAAGEATQEFVESGGESLAQSAQGGFGDLNQGSLDSALVSGALAAPLGAGVGGLAGAPNAVSEVRAENRATVDQIADNEAALGQQRQGIRDTLAGDAQVDRLRAQAEVTAQDAQVDQALADNAAIDADLAAVDARAQELNAELTEQFGVVQEAGPDTPLNQVGQLGTVVATVANSLNPNAQVFDDATFAQAITRFKNDPLSLRALYRNQSQAAPTVVSPEGETLFVEQITAIPDDVSVSQARQLVTQAFESAGSTPATQSFRQQTAEQQVTAQVEQRLAADQRSDAAVSNFQQGIVDAPDNGSAPAPTPVEIALATSQDQLRNSTAETTAASQERQQSSAEQIAVQQTNDLEQQAAVTEVFSDNFEVPEASDGTRGQIRAARAPIPTVENTLGATNPEISDEAFARLFVDVPSSTQNRALEGLLRNSVPNITASEASLLADRIVDRTEALGDGLTKESALNEINQIITRSEQVINETVNNPEPDPDPPATPAQPAPTPEPTTNVIADQVFTSEGEPTPEFEADIAAIEGVKATVGSLPAVVREGLQALTADGEKGVSLRSLRKGATALRKIRRAIEAGEEPTEADRRQLLRSIDLYRRAEARGKPEAPAEGATADSVAATPETPTQTRRSVAAPRSVALGAQFNAQGLLPEGVSTQVQQFLSGDVQQIVDRITQSWKKKADIVIVQSSDQLPEQLQAAGDNSAGLSDGSTAYLIADNLSSESQIADVLLEEVFHRGILKSLGGNYDRVLDTVFNARGGVEGLLRLVSRYSGRGDFANAYRDVIADAQSGDKQAQRELTDEALAQMAVNTELPSGLRNAVNRIVASIKSAIRNTFPSLLPRYSDNDLLQLVSRANQAGRTGGVNTPTVIRASRKLQPGEYLGTDATTGERRIFRAASAQSENVPSLREAVVQRAQGYLGSLERATRTDPINPNTLDRLRIGRNDGTGIGPAFFRSGFWDGVVSRIANARFKAEKHEKEIDFGPKNIASRVIDDIKLQENTPVFLKKILDSKVNDSLKRVALGINSHLTRYKGIANDLARRDLVVTVNGQETTLYDAVARYGEAKGVIQDLEGLSDEQTEQQLSLYATAEHAEERNLIAWAKNVTLSDPNARAQQAAFVNNEQGVSGNTPAQLQALIQSAEQFATTPLDEYRGAGITNLEAREILANVNADPDKAILYKEATQRMREVQLTGREIRRENGSISTSLQNAIDLYGWEFYVPLRGKGTDLNAEPDQDLGPVFTQFHADNEFSRSVRALEGRESLAEGVPSQIIRDALNAVTEYAGRDLLESVAINARGATTSELYRETFERDGSGGRLLEGNVREMDINGAEFKAFQSTKKAESLVLYDPENKNNPDDQRALVITLSNPDGAAAVLGARSQNADALDNLLRKASIGGKTIHDVTSLTASLKTSRNLPFIPYDAIRTILTLGYESAVQGGGPGFKSYLSQFTAPGIGNYGKQILDYVQLYNSNQFDKIAERVSAEPNGIFAELDEFYRLGGPVNFLQAIQSNAAGSLEGIREDTNEGGKGVKKFTSRNLRKLDNTFNILNMTADSLSRLAYFKSLKDRGVPPEVAAARAKNTANFENRGTWSGPLGGVFEFFRATAAGSTALINSTLTGEYGPQTAAAAFGAGASLYLMANALAGVDDEGEDRMGQINGALYNNNFVFQYGDTSSERLQIGLGFGPIAAMISSGIHAARLMTGHADVGNALENMSSAISAQYKVVPASSISPLDTFDFVSSSITPSVLKPWAEVQRNLTSLGIPVRSDYAGADSGDLTGSFAGRYSSEQEMYEQVTQGLRNSGFANINPDDFRHIMRSYGGTLAYLSEAVFENVQELTDPDFAYRHKQGNYIARQFFGSTYSQEPSDFYEHYKRMEDLDNQANKFEAAGNLEEANAIRDSEVYAEGIDLYRQAKADLKGVNDQFKPIFRLDSTTTAEKREAEAERNRLRLQIFRPYLQALEGLDF